MPSIRPPRRPKENDEGETIFDALRFISDAERRRDAEDVRWYATFRLMSESAEAAGVKAAGMARAAHGCGQPGIAYVWRQGTILLRMVYAGECGSEHLDRAARSVEAAATAEGMEDGPVCSAVAGARLFASAMEADHPTAGRRMRQAAG